MSARDWAPAVAERCGAELAAGPPTARTLAAAWIAELGPRWGWSSPWTSVLRRLREDSDLDVRTSARAVWLARG